MPIAVRILRMAEPDTTVCLLDCPIGQSGRLCRVAGDPALARRLAELGLRCGATVTATQRTSGGGRVIATGDLRVALDRQVAASLHVLAEDVPRA